LLVLHGYIVNERGLVSYSETPYEPYIAGVHRNLNLNLTLDMPPCYCSHANCNGADISNNKYRKHRIEDEKVARSVARKANRIQAADDIHVQVSDLSLHGSSGPTSRERVVTHFETSVPVTDTRPARPTDEREAIRIRELYQSVVEIDSELHEHLHKLANVDALPLNALLAEEAWFQGTLQRLQAVKTGDQATALVLTSVIDNTTKGLNDVKTRREEIEKASEVNKGDDAYDTGVFFRSSNHHFVDTFW